MIDSDAARGDSTDSIELGPFLRKAAHEIANPLGAISMNAELAKMLLGQNQNARAGEVLDRLIADCTRIGKLIHGIQQFGSGMQRFEHQRVSLHSVVNDAREMISREHQSVAAPAPELQLRGNDFEVTVDRHAIARVLAGLVANSFDAGASSVQVSVDKKGTWASIHIIDDGEGIDESERSKVVEAFYSTRRKKGGAGLGLTLVREVMQAHAGSMSIAPRRPRGTCVELQLPVAHH